MKQLQNITTDAMKLETKLPMFSKLGVIKNLMVISGSCLLTFTSHDGLLVLQSTMNSEKGIGVISIAIQSAFSCLSALLLPKYFIKKFGCKTVLVVSMLTFFPFIASNFYPHWLLMIVSSVLLGVGYSLLWSSHCAYLNCISNVYAEHIQPQSAKISEECNNHYFSEGVNVFPETQVDGLYTVFNSNESTNQLETTGKKVSRASDKKDHGRVSAVESTTARFFGFHAMMYQLCYVTSSLISFYVFKTGSAQHSYGGNSSCSCGADYCNVDTECSKHNLAQPSDTTKYTLLSIFLMFSVLSVILVFMFLDALRKENDKECVKLSLDFLLATCRRVKEKNQLFLIPLSLYIGLGQGFYIGDITKSYVGCAWGMQNIALVTVCCGLTMAVCSPISGWLVKHLGRLPIFLAALLMNVTVIVILLLWKPDSNSPYMFFIASGIWGSLFGILWSQLRAFYGVLFRKDEEAAFGSYQLWHSIGQCLSLSYSNYICTYVKVYILLSVSILGFTGYFIVERSHAVKDKTRVADFKLHANK